MSKQQLITEGALDYWFLYKFIKKLATPFTKWEAYNTGAIDENGNLKLKMADFNNEQKDSFNRLDLMISKMKRLLNKVPGGRFTTYAAALYLLKEGHENFDEKKFELFIEEIVNVSDGGSIAGLPPDEPPIFKKKRKKKNVRDFIGAKN